jgi:hypothetical protein
MAQEWYGLLGGMLARTRGDGGKVPYVGRGHMRRHGKGSAQVLILLAQVLILLAQVLILLAQVLILLAQVVSMAIAGIEEVSKSLIRFTGRETAPFLPSSA